MSRGHSSPAQAILGTAGRDLIRVGARGRPGSVRVERQTPAAPAAPGTGCDPARSEARRTGVPLLHRLDKNACPGSGRTRNPHPPHPTPDSSIHFCSFSSPQSLRRIRPVWWGCAAPAGRGLDSGVGGGGDSLQAHTRAGLEWDGRTWGCRRVMIVTTVASAAARGRRSAAPASPESAKAGAEIQRLFRFLIARRAQRRVFALSFSLFLIYRQVFLDEHKCDGERVGQCDGKGGRERIYVFGLEGQQHGMDCKTRCRPNF